MANTITTTIWDYYYDFLNKEAKRKKVTKKSIIEKWLYYYKKYELEEQVKKWFEYRKKEYKQNINSFRELQFNSLKD